MIELGIARILAIFSLCIGWIMITGLIIAQDTPTQSELITMYFWALFPFTLVILLEISFRKYEKIGSKIQK